MKFRTHISLGVLIFFILEFLFGFNNKVLSFFLIIIFSILPDIDLHTSYLGKKFKIISRSFELILSHRGIIHSIWVALVLYLLLMRFKLELTVIGYISHLILDMFTKKGIKLFWPFLSIKGFCDTGKLIDIILFYSFSILNIIFLIIFLVNI
jgi:inner membrane protein